MGSAEPFWSFQWEVDRFSLFGFSTGSMAPVSPNGDGDWSRIGSGKEWAQIPPAEQPDGISTFWSQAQRKPPAENQDLLLLGPSSTGKRQQNFSGSFTDISWQPHDIKHPEFIFNFFPPWNNISPSLSSLQDNLGCSCPQSNKHSALSFLQQLSWTESRVSPIPRTWERVQGTEVCSTRVLSSNSWTHACGITNMRVQNCFKGFQAKHWSTFRSLWNPSGQKLLTVWSMRLWNSFPREVLERLSFESFSAEGNIPRGTIPH